MKSERCWYRYRHPVISAAFAELGFVAHGTVSLDVLQELDHSVRKPFFSFQLLDSVTGPRDYSRQFANDCRLAQLPPVVDQLLRVDRLWNKFVIARMKDQERLVYPLPVRSSHLVW